MTSATHWVLIVEDDVDIRESLAEVLEDHHYAPQTAANGVEALALLRAQPRKPCVILLDIMMPVMNGRDFREEQLRDPTLSAIPVIVLSAQGQAAETAVQMKASSFLPKPVDLDTLLATVQSYCA